MNERLEIIFSELDNCNVFADIGCDHGLMTKAMVDSGKCQKAIISDVSKKCLEKAESLLAKEIISGKVISVVSDGFDNVPACDLALIAGMGGEEIALILKKAMNLPEKLVLQPMKNPQKVRVTAVGLGYKIKKDYVFSSGKIFYDLIVLEKGIDNLSEDEIEFGRTNINSNNLAFKSSVNLRLKKLREYLLNSAISKDTELSMKKEIEKLEKYV